MDRFHRLFGLAHQRVVSQKAPDAALALLYALDEIGEAARSPRQIVEQGKDLPSDLVDQSADALRGITLGDALDNGEIPVQVLALAAGNIDIGRARHADALADDGDAVTPGE